MDPRKTIGGEIVKRSALGLVAIYNRLPESCKQARTVKTFQMELQAMLKARAEGGGSDWQAMLSPRKTIKEIMF